jgi:hypothetical protein
MALGATTIADNYEKARRAAKAAEAQSTLESADSDGDGPRPTKIPARYGTSEQRDLIHETSERRDLIHGISEQRGLIHESSSSEELDKEFQGDLQDYSFPIPTTPLFTPGKH